MNSRTGGPVRRFAFTLVELLVVISIFVLILAVAVPAFSSMLYSSEQSLAENSVRTAISAARDVALRSPAGTDAAAVFFYDPVVQRMTIVPCVRAGVIQDGNGLATPPVYREVFVAAAGFEPVQMPRGWTVRGYAAPGMIDSSWYEKTYFSVAALRTIGNWVFPETGFYDEDAPNGDDGADRQTFMVRFEGSTGILQTADLSPVLVLAVTPVLGFHNTSPWNITVPPANGQPFRPDLEPDPVKFVRRVSAAPATGQGALTIAQRQKLLGDLSDDTVLAKPVAQLAVCSEKRLAGAIGVRPDPKTECLYQDVSTLPNINREPTFVLVNGAPFSATNVMQVNDWIEGHLTVNGNAVDSDCRILAVNRYLGTLQELSGSVNGQGVQ
jgi:prepilin-type N-terminal cleavage/methylation domain-containing protein